MTKEHYFLLKQQIIKKFKTLEKYLSNITKVYINLKGFSTLYRKKKTDETKV